MTPADIERIVGLAEGNIFQGELTLQQMFFLRPVPAGPSTALRSQASINAARHASRRRRDGRLRPQRRAADPRALVNRAIVIGGGADALVAAQVLARPGARSW